MKQSTDLQEGYDKYYEGGSRSVYNKRYKDKRYTERESGLLKKHILTKAQELKRNGKNIIRILDFGCGDGRLFPAIQEISLELKKMEMNFELTGCDISNEGLKVFSEQLQSFEFISGENNPYNRENIEPQKIFTLSRGQDSASLWCTSTQTSAGEIAANIENSDISICMFGSLSHIMESSKRQDMLQMLAMKSDYLVLTVPSRNIFKKHQEDSLEKRLSGEDIEEGAIEYEVRGENGELVTKNPYYLYKTSELEKDLKIAGWKNTILEADTFTNPIELTKKPTLDLTNAFLAENFGSLLVEQGTYIVATAQSSKEFEMQPAKITSPRFSAALVSKQLNKQ